METNPILNFFQIPLDRPEFPPVERKLYRASTAFLLYTPIMLGFSFLGLSIIYIIAYLGLLDNPDSKLLVVAFISLLFAGIHLLLFPYAKLGNTEMVTTGLLITSILSGLAQVFVWADNIIAFPLVLIIIPTVTFLYFRNIRIQIRIRGFIFGSFITLVVLQLNSSIPNYYQRMDFSSLSQIAGFTIYILVITTLITLAAISGVISFRSISSRLITTFAFVAILSAISIAIIASVASLFQDHQLAINELETISNLKVSEINESLLDLKHDVNLMLQDQTIAKGINILLSTPLPSSQIYEFNYNLVLSHFQTLETNSTKYDEILLIDENGKVLLSTQEKNKNKNFNQNTFFYQSANNENISLDSNFPEAKDNIVLLITKSLLVKGKNLGMLVIRSNLDKIQIISEARVNNNKINSYLVASIAGKNINLTKTNEKNIIIDIDTIKLAINKNNGNWGIYNNNRGNAAFVSYRFIKEVGIALITDIELSTVDQRTINLLYTNIVVGLFTAALGFTIIYITSQSISNPIINLVEKANALATGAMNTRITIDREDEIGGLSSSFNIMAEQLQNLVRTLEEKVEDRTHGLQVQANRLLLAAEIARDAATLGDLDELLDRSSHLVLERFNFYHTSIFLIDQQREYAILRASPTEAGYTMLKQNYRLRLGQEGGIIGNVAVTGDVQIIADTKSDSNYLINPLLPQTRSELAIPLKVETRVTGILDVQSETADAFTQDDIAVLQIMADQLALAIERVQLVKQLEGRLSELEHAYQQFTVTSWQDFSQQPGFKAGYSFDGLKLSAIVSSPAWSQDTLRRGRPVILPGKTTNSKDSLLAVPLKLRGQIIGILTIRFTVDSLNTETISLAEEIANRLTVALENARLYTETQKLAQQERAVSEISTRITASINIENILRTAVQELSHMMPEAEITVQLQEEKEE